MSITCVWSFHVSFHRPCLLVDVITNKRPFGRMHRRAAAISGDSINFHLSPYFHGVRVVVIAILQSYLILARRRRRQLSVSSMANSIHTDWYIITALTSWTRGQFRVGLGKSWHDAIHRILPTTILRMCFQMREIQSLLSDFTCPFRVLSTAYWLVRLALFHH